MCQQLASRGEHVFLGSRDPSRGRAAAQALAGLAGPVEVVELDITSAASIEALPGAIWPVDVLVNNAAVHYDTGQSVETADFAIVREAFEANLFGAWQLARAFAPAMRKAGWGRIVNVSSESGSLAGMGGGTPAYATSKAALYALTRIHAAELRGTGVLVNAICPGWTNTDMGGGGRPVEAGARSVLWGVDLRDDGPTGGFFRDGRPLPW